MDEGPYLETLYSLERESDDGTTPPRTGFPKEAGESVSIESISFSPHFSESTTVVAEFEPFPSRKPLAELKYDSLLGRASKENCHNGIAFPLMNESEVRLMRYYIDYMCHWFDLCDTRSNHFAQEVPKRAITSPTLLNAIFAVSSRHLSIAGQFDQYASDRYHQECLKHLATIPVESSDLDNDDLLAATILLRTLEELDVPLVGEDFQGHLLGIQVFMNSQDPLTPASGLRQASFWVGLRQEIQMSFVNPRPIKTKLDHSFIDKSFSPADDDTWAKRIIVNTAEVVNFCFGEEERNISVYQKLKDYDSQWLESRPLSFLPLAYRAADPDCGEVFPEAWYFNHAVVIGVTHAIIGRVLLMCYNPTLPRIGPSHKTAIQQMEEEIKSQIRELCGIALSNRWTIPAMFTACMGVTMCGDRFTDHSEQEALLGVLMRTEQDHAWPTRAAQTHLRRAWGWEIET
ncbi:hypothetical protein N431DRAFT_374527 [Stipitochalara longipes BDJ]|nr:hypothetical protein N431DRAFT_374527 [Stipitochalara longipes BDJ]